MPSADADISLLAGPQTLAGEAPPRQLAGRLAGLSLPRQVAVLAVWPLLEQLLTFLVTFVDTMQAGHLDPDAVAAVGVAGYIIGIVGLIESAAGIGAIAIIARATAAPQRRLVNATLGQSLVLAVFAGAIMAAVLLLLAPSIGAFVGLTGRGLQHTILFLRILALATPMSFMLFVGGACYRGAGNTAMPFRIMLAVNVVNVAGNYTFVRGPLPLGGHGVAGIAWATDLAWSPARSPCWCRCCAATTGCGSTFTALFPTGTSSAAYCASVCPMWWRRPVFGSPSSWFSGLSATRFMPVCRTLSRFMPSRFGSTASAIFPVLR